MKTAGKVARNSSIYLGGNVIFRILSVLVTIYLARYLGVSEFGTYSIVFAYIAFFNIIPDLGIQTILVREIARNESDLSKIIGNAYILRILLTLLAFGTSVLLINFMSYPEDIRIYTYIAAFTIFFISFSDFYTTGFQAKLRMEYDVIAKISFKIISAILIFWIIFTRGTLAQIFVAIVFSYMVKMCITYYFSRRFIKPVFEFDLGIWKYLLKECFPLALLSIITITTQNIGIILLSKMVSEASVGIFSAAQKFIQVLWIIPGALTISLFPVMSSFYKSEEKKLEKLLILSIKYVFMIILPIAVGVTLLGNKIIILVYGNQFADASIVLQLLVWGFVFGSMTTVMFNSLVSINRQHLVTLSFATGTIINVLLNIILIPTLAHVGTAIASVSASLIIFISAFYFTAKSIKLIPIHELILKPVICSLLMGGFVYYFISLNLFILVPLAVMIYIISLLALKVMSDEEINLIKSIIPINFKFLK